MSNIALITGATSGIGAAFARKLASLNYDLIITGRREEKINALAKELKNQYKIQVEVIIAELADDQAVSALATKIKSLDNLEILINNAGFGRKGSFFQEEIAPYEQMIKVHMLVTMQLTHAALPKMLARNSGTIINVSSIAAFIPWLHSIVYGATKAFINKFTAALARELKGRGVRFQALCPGITDTDFFPSMGTSVNDFPHIKTKLFKPMTSESVVEKSLQALAKNQLFCTPGVLNKLVVFCGKLSELF